MPLFGWLPFTFAPVNTILSLLLMQGISLSMWRQFLNQTIPPFNIQRFTQNRPRFALSFTNTPAPDINANAEPSRLPLQQNYQSLGLLQPSSQLQPQQQPAYQQMQIPLQVQPVQPMQVPIQPVQQLAMQPMQVQPLQIQQPIQMPQSVQIQQPIQIQQPVQTQQVQMQQPVSMQIQPMQMQQPVSVQMQPVQTQSQPQPVPPQIIVMTTAGQTQKSAPQISVPATVVQQMSSPAVVMKSMASQSSTTIPVQIPAPKRRSSKTSDISSYEFITSNVPQNRKSLIPPPITTEASIPNSMSGTEEKSNDLEENADNEVDTNENENKDNNESQFKRVCYYLLETKGETLQPKDIDAFICSHLIAAFVYIDDNDLLKLKTPEDDLDKIRQFKRLKEENKELKLMLSISDEKRGARFSKMASTEKSMKKFIDSVLEVVSLYNFDGIDLDWEYPAYKGSPPSDRINFITLLKKFKSEAKKSGKSKFIVTAAVATPLAIATLAYDIPQLANVTDFVNLISYDYHYYRIDRPYTGHLSPLFSRPNEEGYFATLNTAWSTAFWVTKGMPAHKIVVGIPMFARTYSLAFPFGQGLDAPVIGTGLGGGKINHSEVCRFLNNGAIQEFDSNGQVPFAHKDYDWVAYENEKSVSVKTRWVVKSRLGGVMTFSLNDDDWKGMCREDKKTFPLQKAIARTLELASITALQNWANVESVTEKDNS